MLTYLENFRLSTNNPVETYPVATGGSNRFILKDIKGRAGCLSDSCSGLRGEPGGL